MKKIKKAVIVIALSIVATVLITCCDPPAREEIHDKPQKYLKVNRYVRKLREEFTEEGRITEGFLPLRIDTNQTVEYLYWYHCALFGDPNYAITVTIHFPDKSSLLGEINRIEDLDGFTEIRNEDYLIVAGKRLLEKVEAFFDPPVEDGTRYSIEYVIISMNDRTITYTELCIWENQILHKTIESQLRTIYKSSKDNG